MEFFPQIFTVFKLVSISALVICIGILILLYKSRNTKIKRLKVEIERLESVIETLKLSNLADKVEIAADFIANEEDNEEPKKEGNGFSLGHWGN